MVNHVRHSCFGTFQTGAPISLTISLQHSRNNPQLPVVQPARVKGAAISDVWAATCPQSLSPSSPIEASRLLVWSLRFWYSPRMQQGHGHEGQGQGQGRGQGFWSLFDWNDYPHQYYQYYHQDPRHPRHPRHIWVFLQQGGCTPPSPSGKK
jgi:hypothetical protein